MAICMSMPGGGPHQVARGQVTDDSELAMALMWGLNKANEEEDSGQPRVFSNAQIAYHYREWMRSEPFDIGSTTNQALSPLLENLDPENSKKSAKALNRDSLSNGGMMRITPLAVWAANLEDQEDLKDAVVADVEFTHPNPLS